MSACETCWSEASRRALLLGGHTADRYREVLAEHPAGHPQHLPTPPAQPDGEASA